MLEKNWVKSVTRKHPRMHSGSQIVHIITLIISKKPRGNKRSSGTVLKSGEIDKMPGE